MGLSDLGFTVTLAELYHEDVLVLVRVTCTDWTLLDSGSLLTMLRCRFWPNLETGLKMGLKRHPLTSRTPVTPLKHVVCNSVPAILDRAW
jgi:hypothetical protein